MIERRDCSCCRKKKASRRSDGFYHQHIYNQHVHPTSTYWRHSGHSEKRDFSDLKFVRIAEDAIFWTAERNLDNFAAALRAVFMAVILLRGSLTLSNCSSLQLALIVADV
jgi:hypothetical protein